MEREEDPWQGVLLLLLMTMLQCMMLLSLLSVVHTANTTIPPSYSLAS